MLSESYILDTDEEEGQGQRQQQTETPGRRRRLKPSKEQLQGDSDDDEEEQGQGKTERRKPTMKERRKEAKGDSEEEEYFDDDDYYHTPMKMSDEPEALMIPFTSTKIRMSHIPSEWDVGTMEYNTHYTVMNDPSYANIKVVPKTLFQVAKVVIKENIHVPERFNPKLPFRDILYEFSLEIIDCTIVIMEVRERLRRLASHLFNYLVMRVDYIAKELSGDTILSTKQISRTQEEVQLMEKEKKELEDMTGAYIVQLINAMGKLFCIVFISWFFITIILYFLLACILYHNLNNAACHEIRTKMNSSNPIGALQVVQKNSVTKCLQLLQTKEVAWTYLPEIPLKCYTDLGYEPNG